MIKVYAFSTPNSVRVPIALEELDRLNVGTPLATSQWVNFETSPPGFEFGFRGKKSMSYLRGHSTENSARAMG
jgi:hypothetical protein